MNKKRKKQQNKNEKREKGIFKKNKKSVREEKENRDDFVLKFGVVSVFIILTFYFFIFRFLLLPQEPRLLCPRR